MQKFEADFWLRFSSIVQLLSAAFAMMVAQIFCFYFDEFYSWHFSVRRVLPPPYAELKEGLKVFHACILGSALLILLFTATDYFFSEAPPKRFHSFMRMIWAMAILCAASSYFGWMFKGGM